MVVVKKFVVEKDIEEISKHVSNFFYEKKGFDISPIKLQKSLYFLFVFWVEKYNQMKNSELRDEIESFSEKLFDVEFQAWSYGPVVQSVYHNRREILKEKENPKYNIDNISKIEIIKEFFKSTLNDVFIVNDFDLVDRSHEDESWINAKNKNGINTIMEINEILDEYREGKK